MRIATNHESDTMRAVIYIDALNIAVYVARKQARAAPDGATRARETWLFEFWRDRLHEAQRQNP
jgi:hypothetical protein